MKYENLIYQRLDERQFSIAKKLTKLTFRALALSHAFRRRDNLRNAPLFHFYDGHLTLESTRLINQIVVIYVNCSFWENLSLSSQCS